MPPLTNNFNLPDCLTDADIISFRKGARIFQAGDACNQFFYIAKGKIRVDLAAKSGRSILLYQFGANETCILTTSCLFSGDNYCAEAHVEEDTWACVIPYSVFEYKLNDSPSFRRAGFFIFFAATSFNDGKN